ncbi:MAG: MogA/MoaB family molybdenum cofactor biosynthesis protein [Phycisphaerales bacterium]|nr:MogA/MoaB family molybdenum cofactor biosynthesis protein [Phycisphaerales bacterium]
MPAPVHKGKTVEHVTCAVLTISDTRTPETDTGGDAIVTRLEAVGHVVRVREILRDEPAQIGERVRALCVSGECGAVLLTGGTGLSPRDTTYEAVMGLLNKQLDGFGELFRMLSYEQVGPAAMLSRAVAGLRGKTAVFAMPGSPKAVELAMDKLIIPELGHIAWLAAN